MQVLPRIDELESIRGIAAFLVFLYHIPLWHPMLFEVNIIRNAHVMVELFFVLSGFVIYRTYAGRLGDFRALVRFQWLRLGRLYPVHLLFLMLWLGIEMLKYLALAYAGVASPNSRPFPETSSQAFIEQLFLVQSLGFSQHATTFNYPAWSISAEFYTYLIFALVAWSLRRWRTLLFAAIALCSVLLLLFANEHIGTFDKILRCLAGFFIGCLTAQLHGLLAERAATRFVRQCIPPLWGALAAIVLLLHFKPADNRFDLLIIPLTAMLIASVIDGTTTTHERVAVVTGVRRILITVLRSRWLVALGGLSYALYMAHASVLWVLNQFFRVVLNVPQVTMSSGQLAPSLPLSVALLAYLVSIVLVLAVSLAVHRLVETPFRQRARQSQLFK